MKSSEIRERYLKFFEKRGHWNVNIEFRILNIV